MPPRRPTRSTSRVAAAFERDRYYISLPLLDANGLLMQLGAMLVAGAQAIVRKRFSAFNWLQDIRKSGTTVTNFLGATAGYVISQPQTPFDPQHTLRAVLMRRGYLHGKEACEHVSA